MASDLMSYTMPSIIVEYDSVVCIPGQSHRHKYSRRSENPHTTSRGLAFLLLSHRMTAGRALSLVVTSISPVIKCR